MMNFDRTAKATDDRMVRCGRCDGWGEENEPVALPELGPGVYGALLHGDPCPGCAGAGTIAANSLQLAATASV